MVDGTLLVYFIVLEGVLVPEHQINFLAQFCISPHEVSILRIKPTLGLIQSAVQFVVLAIFVGNNKQQPRLQLFPYGLFESCSWTVTSQIMVPTGLPYPHCHCLGPDPDVQVFISPLVP